MNKIGVKIEHKPFFLNFSGAPGYPGKIPGYPAKKVWFPWVSRDIPNFRPPPLHLENPHPTGGYPDPKIWVWDPFSSLIRKNHCGPPIGSACARRPSDTQPASPRIIAQFVGENDPGIYSPKIHQGLVLLATAVESCGG